jgi:NAD(P)-dependent dehydrogenase (short-subunit alcohol dehydrogenase family)
MERICEGRVAVVTGAARGIGRGHAVELARQGAKVVVNDLGAEVDGSGASISPAQQVVDDIVASGGEAVVNGDDVSTAAGADGLVKTALDAFGDLHVVINNAGILRDRMIVNLSEDDWDGVLAVHLRATFLTTRAAGRLWRDRAKSGETNDARIINTSSVSGLFGNVGQSNYGAEGGHRRLHDHHVHGAGPLRHHRQRPLTERSDPHDHPPGAGAHGASRP